LLMAEVTMGFTTQKTAINAYKAIMPGKKWYLAGYLHIIAGVSVAAYTIPIYAWILNYITNTAAGTFIGMNSTEVSNYFTVFSSDYKVVFFYAFITYILEFVVLRGGLQNGVEKLSKYLLPALAVIMLVVIVAGLRLEGSSEGIAFLLKPDFSKFTMDSLLAALGQAFFAIGIAMLASMVFGSYISNKDENILKSASVISSSIVVAGVMAGFMIFPMLFSFGLEPAAGPGLTFITLPNVFNKIVGGRIIGTLFYLGFYIAAFTSSTGLIESIVGVFMDQFKLSRIKALSTVMVILIIIGIPSILSDSFFNIVDVVTNNYIIVIGAFIISIFTGWIWGIDNCLDAANVENKFLRMWISVSVKYISPIVIIIIFATSIF
ncbi:MAG: sodium-dependent transporter, partial [Intestinibacter sp.]